MKQEELKYRAWDKEDRRWLNSDDFRIDGNGTIFTTDYDRPPEWNVDENIVVVQYTRKKVKRTEMYEGDIVTFKVVLHARRDEEQSKLRGGLGYGIVERLDTGEYMIASIPKLSLFEAFGAIGKPTKFIQEIEDAIEIIGNKFENPELLK